jgi:hypothetical protein
MSLRNPKVGLVWLGCICVTSSLAADQVSRERDFRAKVQPLLKKYCADCHGGGVTEGDLDLDRFESARDVLRGREEWLKVLQKLAVAAMPPKDADQPSPAERRLLMAWVDDVINHFDCEAEARPGRVTLHRLNQVEYRNTIRDLVGVDYEPAQDFPADDVGYGFDNIGDVLSLPPILLEKYLDAAEVIANKAIVRGGSRLPLIARKSGAELRGGTRVIDRVKGSKIIVSNGLMTTTVKIAKPGKYEIHVTAYGDQAGNEPVKMGLLFDGKQITTFNVKATATKPGEYTAETRVTAGDHEIAVSFLNDYYRPKEANGDRNMIVNSIVVRGPLGSEQPRPASHQAIVFVMPGKNVTEQQATSRIVERLASRAFRRPATKREVDRLSGLAAAARDRGQTFEQSIQLAMQAILISPNFIFRVEADPNEGQTERQLNDYELASRLSYFLWSTMPDAALYRDAWGGKLSDGDTLRRHVQRLLKDKRARALVDNFAAQWLNLRKFDELEPSPRHFPAFTPQLRDDMRKETSYFFGYIVREDRSVLELLSADYSYLNERLAQHYGIPDVKGMAFRRVSLANSPRGGIITQGSILTLTSNPTRTSPVKRGKWILENLLGQPPPPPPPDIPDLDDEKRMLKGSIREQLEQHRANPACAVCHEQMDGLGFALENFDAIGGWRQFDGPYIVNPMAELPSGEKFNGPKELAQVLRQTKQQEFVRCLSEKLLTYALGRGLEYYDKCAVDKIAAAVVKNDFRFSAMVVAIVESEPFQRRGAVEKP